MTYMIISDASNTPVALQQRYSCNQLNFKRYDASLITILFFFIFLIFLHTCNSL